jgi:hypothetical protein
VRLPIIALPLHCPLKFAMICRWWVVGAEQKLTVNKKQQNENTPFSVWAEGFLRNKEARSDDDDDEALLGSRECCY